MWVVEKLINCCSRSEAVMLRTGTSARTVSVKALVNAIGNRVCSYQNSASLYERRAAIRKPGNAIIPSALFEK